VVARRNISALDYPQNFAARYRQGLHYSHFCAIRRLRAQRNQSVTLRDNPKSDANPLSSVSGGSSYLQSLLLREDEVIQ